MTSKNINIDYIQSFYDFVSMYQMSHKDSYYPNKNTECLGEIAFEVYSSFNQLRDGTFKEQINGELRGYNSFLLLQPKKMFFIVNQLSYISDFKENSFLKKCIFFCYFQKLKILFFQAVNINHSNSDINAIDLNKDIVNTLTYLITLKNELNNNAKYKSYYMFYDNLSEQNAAFDYLYNLFDCHQDKIFSMLKENNFENDSFNIFFNYISCIYRQIATIPEHIVSLLNNFQTSPSLPSLNASVFGLGTLPIFHVFLSFKKNSLFLNLKFPQNEKSIEASLEHLANLENTSFNQINISQNVCNAFQKILFPHTISKDIETNNIYNNRNMRVYIELLNEYFIKHNINKTEYAENIFENLKNFHLTSEIDINLNKLCSIIRADNLLNSLSAKTPTIINNKNKI